MQINDCSKLPTGTPEHTRCEGANALLKRKQEQDADCNKRIEAAKKSSLTVLMGKYNCTEQLPPQSWEDYFWSFVTPQNFCFALAVAIPTGTAIGLQARHNNLLANVDKRTLEGIKRTL